MKIISIDFTDQQAREIDYFLRKKYKKDKRTGLSRLCKIAVFHEIQTQAKKDVEEDNRTKHCFRSEKQKRTNMDGIDSPVRNHAVNES